MLRRGAGRCWQTWKWGQGLRRAGPAGFDSETSALQASTPMRRLTLQAWTPKHRSTLQSWLPKHRSPLQAWTPMHWPCQLGLRRALGGSGSSASANRVLPRAEPRQVGQVWAGRAGSRCGCCPIPTLRGPPPHAPVTSPSPAGSPTPARPRPSPRAPSSSSCPPPSSRQSFRLQGAIRARGRQGGITFLALATPWPENLPVGSP